ncbi:hypothetical protein, partial [Klebsiella pneumoniae]|uniref:hypothetical protein n=1 Tax=Klebsiella pneumoniae TaxID=573 RepID=UPI003A86FAEE
MAITTRGGKQNIDPPMPSGEENVIRGDDEVVEVSGDLGDKTVKEVEVPQMVTPMPRPPPQFPQRLIKKDRGWKILTFYHYAQTAFHQCPLTETIEQK